MRQKGESVLNSFLAWIAENPPWPIVPPLVAITLALWTRQIFLALVVGIWLGYMILAKAHPLTGTLDTLNAFVTVLTDPDNARLVMFTLIIGPLIALVQRSGGVEGFVTRILNFLERVSHKQHEKGNRKIVESLAVLTGLVLCIETNISLFTVGTVYRPIFDKLKIPREKLAYIADSTSAPTNILMPFNAWGAYIMGLLVIYTRGDAPAFDSAFGVLAGTIIYNFYPILTIALLFVVIWSGRDIADMKKAEARAAQSGKILRDGAVPMMDETVSMLDAKPGAKPRAFNMVIPVASMVVLMITFLIYTGWGDASGDGVSRYWDALSQGSGSSAVLYAVTFAILIAMTMYRVQGIMNIAEMVDLSLKAMAGMTNVAILAVLAFALNAMCNDIGTGQYMADIASMFITPALVPAIIFIIAALIGFSTGTSWGTFAIMIAVAVPLSQSMDVNLYMAVAAALGGGVFGDHCSPTSDTTIIASMATANDHIDHVRTQIPYALIAAAGTVLIYLILGFAGI